MLIWLKRTVLIIVFFAVLVSAYFVPFILIGNSAVEEEVVIPQTPDNSKEKITARLNADRLSVPVGDKETVSLFLDSRDLPVEAISLIVNYPADRLKLERIDVNLPDFDVLSPMIDHQNGRLEIAGNTQEILAYGRPAVAEIARLTLTAMASGAADLYFDPDSRVISGGTNMLGSVKGAKISIY